MNNSLFEMNNMPVVSGSSEQNVANYTAGPYYDYGEVKEKHNSYTIKIQNSSVASDAS